MPYFSSDNCLFSADDYVDAITFEGGPITHEERKILLQSINQFTPRRRSSKNDATEKAKDDVKKKS